MGLRLGLGLGLPNPTGEGVGGFSLDAYMASLSDGLYFDATRTDRFFQENTGPTLADDVGESIGLALDQRAWGGKTLAEVLSAQPELVTNGDFSNGSAGWTDASTGGASISFAGGQATTVVPSGTAILTQPIACAIGDTVKVDMASAAGWGIGTSSGGAETVGVSAGTSKIFVATATTHYITVLTGTNGRTVDNVSAKKIPGKHATQATGTLKPTRQTTGAKFDGSDDNWLTPYLAGTGSNFVVALVTAPASVPAFQYIFGSTDGNRFGIGVNPDGTVGFAAGSTSPISAKGTTDIRNVESVIGMSCDGANVLGFVDAAQEYASALAGSLNTTTPVRIGAINGSGTANSFYGGAIKKLVAGRDALALARYQQIRNALLAA